MKSYLSMLMLLSAIFIVASCTDELSVTGEMPVDVLYRGEPVDVSLNLGVGGFLLNITNRAEGGEAEPEKATEAEQRVKDIWVFQYACSDGALVGSPIYYSIADQDELKNLSFTLKDIGDEKSVVYVVANTGDATWAKDTAHFRTMAQLKEQALPAQEPIFSTDKDWAIPMAGHTEEVTVTKNTLVTVPIYRMYAKIMMRVNIHLDRSVLYNIIAGNIPEYCRVESLAEDLDDDTAAAAYPSDIQWISRTFKDSIPNVAYPYIMYVPENLQGKEENNKDMATAPRHAFALNVSISYTDDEGGTLQYPYVMFPGANAVDDYNIKRNHVYRITANINALSEARVPSANCFAIAPDETLAFYPYCRTETGGGYEFEDYLDPTSMRGEKIDSVSIVWQSKDCIGDNSAGDRVWMEDYGRATHTGFEKIYVKAKAEGNALIAAYNAEKEIIWSWHIWVRKDNPTNEANALKYYTYSWDEGGIYTSRVPGYQIMPCNLGALRNEPLAVNDTASIKMTFGMLYQWGRKDPFPPMTRMDHRNVADGNSYQVHPYNVSHIGQYYGNDNATKLLATPHLDDGQKYLFHSYVDTNESEHGEGIAYSIKHPTVFMCGTKEASKAWDNKSPDYVKNLANYINNGAWSSDDHDSGLWGGLDPAKVEKKLPLNIFDEAGNEITIYDDYGDAKSIFDPCPKGWRVSSSDLWLGFSIDGLNPSKMEDINYDPANSSDYGMTMYLGENWREGGTSYFPCQGFRFADGTGFRVGGCGNYLNANTDANDRVDIIHIHNAKEYFNIFEVKHHYTVKSTASPLRCVRESK